MKRFIMSKKGLVLLAALVVAIAASVGAYAYFTSTGTGTGSATVGTASNWTVGQTGVNSGGPLYPDPSIGGANVQDNAYHVKNNNAGNQSLANVAISVANSNGSAWSAQADTNKPACTKDDFSVGGEAVGVTHNDTSLAGTFTAGQDKTTGSVTVELIDNGANQDNCQGVTVPLYFSAS
jgi:hypothetical protein